MTEKKLAKIKSARVIMDGGFLSFRIDVNYEDGYCQAIGHLALDKPNKKTEGREGTAYGCEMIRRLMIEVGCDFEEMKNQIIWVYGERNGSCFKVSGIERLHVNKDRGYDKQEGPFIFEEVEKEFK